MHSLSEIGACPPAVSVIIPTRWRPLLVVRAVTSALAQSLRDIEVIVVIDGPDTETELALRGIHDQRLHVLSLDKNLGGSEARNAGVRAARGKWIAFLDDDDEWFPEKLSKQWAACESIDAEEVIVACQFIERTELADRVLPRRLPEVSEPFSEYMFVRHGWNSGEGFLQTSTWVVSRSLLIEAPFTPGLKRCQDLDWLLHATFRPQTKVVVLPEVLAIFHHDERAERVSRTSDWRFLYDWATSNRRYFTPRAFAFFIATFCVPAAAKEREGWGTLLFLLWECLAKGALNGKCVALFFGCWFVSEAKRRSMRAFVEKFRPGRTRGHSVAVSQPLASKAR